ncbi:uncharacterized protein LOC121727205 [Aricia agestis]|uniref:uncharacterized protein LOC121727205 n=1 Tax=Aricia agestis TaxID=91739 RepID=UPI001C20A7B4|nr:uncharacterized protein LOC121727205 [Aricia agestis]
MSEAKPIIIQKNKLKTLKCMNGDIIQEDVIYRATPNDFLNGKYPNLVISNKLNKLNNSSQTQATFSSNNSSVELTSDAVTQVIGQKNYDLVLAALCSVINQDLKIKAILSLLSTKKISSNIVVNSKPKSGKYNVSTQTEQSSMTLLMKEKLRRNRKSRVAKPYVVTDQLNKVIIHPNHIKSEVNIKKNEVKQENGEEYWPNLKLMDEELSNASWGSTSNLSILSDNIPNKVLDPQFMLNNIDKHTEYILSDYDTSTKCIGESNALLDGQQSNIADSRNPAVKHSISDSLQVVSSEGKLKLVVQQALTDFKLCIQRNEDDNLPIHQAVLEDNPSMLKRFCIMSSVRGESLDELSGNNFTALQMSIFRNSVQCMAVLLQYGADVFVTDDDGRTCFHLAAENDTDHLKLLVEHCKKNPSMVMEQNEELWNSFTVRNSNENISKFLLRSICTTCDLQGYTPLMLASKSGVAKNVKLLIDIAPDTINMVMPNCGNTALYLAVAAACVDADDRQDKSDVSANYLQTVETLIVNGGDPYLQNSSGSNVNDLLSDSHTGNQKPGYLIKLSLLIANKLTSVKYFKGSTMRNFEKYMLVKNSQGDISIADINESHKNKIVTSEIQSSTSDTIPSKHVTSDDNTIPETPIVESRAAKTPVVILQDIPIVSVAQVANVTRNDCVPNKTKPSVRPLILKKNKIPKASPDVALPVIKYIIIPKVKGVAKPKVKRITKPRVKNTSKAKVKAGAKPAIKDVAIPEVKDKTTSEVKETATPKLNTTNSPLKFVKILPKVDPSTDHETTGTKRLNIDVEPTACKKIKRNSVNINS